MSKDGIINEEVLEKLKKKVAAISYNAIFTPLIIDWLTVR